MAILGRRQPFHQRRLSSLVIGAVTAYTLSCAAGAYTVTGTAAGLKADRKVSAVAGSYAVAGADAGLKSGRKAASAAGSYAISGASAGLKAARTVSSSAGSYALSGSAAGLKSGRNVGASAGGYTITGAAASLNGGHVVSAGAGAYTDTGTAAGLKAGRTVSIGSGAYVITGASVTLVKTGSQTMVASAGSYTDTGSDATLRQRTPPPVVGGRVRAVPQAPIRTPVFNYQTPLADPSHYLFTRVWIAFLTAVQSVCDWATYTIASASVTAQSATITLTPLTVRSVTPLAGTTTLFPEGKYRLSASARLLTVAGTSSSLGVVFSWTSNGIARSYFGPLNTSNDLDQPDSTTLLIVADANTEIQYEVDYISVGSPAMTYAADIVVEALSA